MSEIADGDLIAGEYVLGVLDAAEMRAVAERALSDQMLAADITAWERQLSPLALLVAPVDAPAALWPRIARSIDGLASAPVRVASIRQLRIWRGATAMSLALAASFAVFAILPRQPAMAPPMTIAALAPLAGQAPAFIVRSLPDGTLRVAALGPERIAPDRDLQLWALPVGATKPTSLGVLPADGKIVPASALTAIGGKLLVSLEPKGGSPTGQPTGPVLYGGTITRI